MSEPKSSTSTPEPGPPDLARLPLFKDMPAADIEAVVKAARIRKVAAGGFFFRQEDPAETLYIIQSGTVKLTQISVEGQQIILGVLGAGGTFGMIAMVPGAIYPVSVEVVSDAVAWTWDHETLTRLAERFPRLALNTMRAMGAHVVEFQDRIRELSLERVERRLARHILRLVRQVGRKVEGGVLLDLAITRQELAEMSGTTLYTVSRILSRWEQDGLIDAGRERVLIKFPHGLVRIAEDID